MRSLFFFFRRQRWIDDFTFPALFAERVKAYLSAYDLGREVIEHVSVKALRNARLNPLGMAGRRTVTERKKE